MRNSAFCVLLHECIHKCQFLKELFATKWVIAHYGWWMGRGMWLCKGRGFFSTSFHPFSKGEVNVVFTLSVLCSGLVIQPSWGKTIDHIWLRNVHLVQYIVSRRKVSCWAGPWWLLYDDAKGPSGLGRRAVPLQYCPGGGA